MSENQMDKIEQIDLKVRNATKLPRLRDERYCPGEHFRTLETG